MVRTYKKDPKAGTHASVDPECVRNAVLDVQRGMALRTAAAKWKISKSALHRYCSKPNLEIGKKGGQTALSTALEIKLVECLKKCAEWGYPLSVFDIRCFIKYHLEREGKVVPKFKDNLPGSDWALSFINRHRNQLSQRICQNIKRSRAAVSPENINAFFEELGATLENVPPHLIINYDESALSDDPGRRKLIFKKGCKYPERIMNQTKAGVTVMFAATASGELLSPYVIYKAVHLYDLWIQGGPQGSKYNRSKSGWIDGHCFLDWLQKIVLPYVRRFEGKKVLIGDNLSSHLSPAVVQTCVENNISFSFLPANSSHLTQPLDVAVFRSLKTHWRAVLEQTKVKAKNTNQPFDKKLFPGLLNQTLIRMKKEDGLKNAILSGFKKSGLCPLNRHRVLERLLNQEKIRIFR
ncbi:uncharacterized protein [Leptinotarsa decemlineata]|uniref:uncharacterized protein n=1 Tax=Leptinotarsa decemlineata TaxID=7539 RepID=UPI003D3061CD